MAHTIAARRITRQYPGDAAPWTVTVWDVIGPDGSKVDSYNYKKDATYAATYADDMTAILRRANS